MNFQLMWSNVCVWTRKHMPDILMVTGLTGICVGTGIACKKSMEIEPILKQHNKEIKRSKICGTDIKKVYANTGLKLAKHYALPTILFTGGMTAVVGSHVQLNKRNSSLSAAYVTLLTSFETYRSNVINKYGKDVDEEFHLGLKKNNSKGNKKDKSFKIVGPNYSRGDRFFDEFNSTYYDLNDNDRLDYNRTLIANVENWANDKLKACKVLWMNDIYCALGMEQTLEGQVDGWMIADDPNNQIGPTYVDFGLHDIKNNPNAKDFLEGKEKSLFLHFNDTEELLYLMK